VLFIRPSLIGNILYNNNKCISDNKLVEPELYKDDYNISNKCSSFNLKNSILRSGASDGPIVPVKAPYFKA
jgi:hypothetical protein